LNLFLRVIFLMLNFFANSFLKPNRGFNQLIISGLQMSEEKRVLSIQSHAVSGYVGNKSAIFPMQLLGFDVDYINTVQFSNHTGYPMWKGQGLKGENLWDLYTGLVENRLDNYTHVVTGYIGSTSFLETTVQLIQSLKEKNPNLIYVCDPVMGDHGKLYVAPELIPLFREKLVPLADIAVPNQFEAEQLTGIKITNLEEALQAIDKIHEWNVKTVVITSTNLTSSKGTITVIGSQIQQMKDGNESQKRKTRFKIEIEELPQAFTGTGDLFSALLLAWTYQHPSDLPLACEKVIATMQAVLKRTFEYSQQKEKELGKIEKIDKFRITDLRLIQSKTDIEQPHVTTRAEILLE